MDRSTPRLVPLLLVVAVAVAVAAAVIWVGRGRATAGDPLPTASHALTSIALPPATTLPPTTTTDATTLHPGLADALSDARSEAARAGTVITITSGFRTADEQARLLAEAIEEHGSREEALRWVFEPERSMHVRGLAIDVGGPGADWLDEHGDRFGLCRTLEWEWWHFEWRDRWQAEGACPSPVHDPAAAPGP